MNPKSPSSTRPLPEFKESATSHIWPLFIRHNAVPSLSPFSFLKIPARGINIVARCRAVAQLGRALEWGSRGREFKSLRPDFFFFENLFTFRSDIETHPICYLGRVIDSLLCFVSGAYPSKRVLSFHFIGPLVPCSFSDFLGPIEIVHLHSLALAKAPSATVSHASPNTPFTLRRTPVSHSNNLLYQQHKRLDIILSF